MADNTTLFKFVAKSVGIKHGIMPTFMTKPYSKISEQLLAGIMTALICQRADCSALVDGRRRLLTKRHIYVSHGNSQGNNIFAVSR